MKPATFIYAACSSFAVLLWFWAVVQLVEACFGAFGPNASSMIQGLALFAAVFAPLFVGIGLEASRVN